jgi:uncharacterized membrane-anchored protein
MGWNKVAGWLRWERDTKFLLESWECSAGPCDPEIEAWERQTVNNYFKGLGTYQASWSQWSCKEPRLGTSFVWLRLAI